jgi:hypothetical protein
MITVKTQINSDCSEMESNTSNERAMYEDDNLSLSYRMVETLEDSQYKIAKLKTRKM